MASVFEEPEPDDVGELLKDRTSTSFNILLLLLVVANASLLLKGGVKDLQVWLISKFTKTPEIQRQNQATENIQDGDIKGSPSIWDTSVQSSWEIIIDKIYPLACPATMHNIRAVSNQCYMKQYFTLSKL